VKEIKERVFRRIDSDEDKIAKLCSDLIRIPSRNPPGDTTEIASFLKDVLNEKGLDVKTFEPRKSMPNLVSTLKGSSDTPHFILNAHMDVFPANGDLWDFDPFGGEIRDGKILGRGASDMKSGLTASLVTFTSIYDLDLPLPGKLTLTLVSDEETGGRWGTGWLLENVPDVLGDACLIGEPSGRGIFKLGEKGTCWLKFTASGKAAHGAWHPLGDNAIVKASTAIPKLMSLKGWKGRTPDELRDIIKTQKRSIENTYGKETSELVDGLSVNVGKINGGTKINIVPASCELEVDFRVPIGITSSEAKTKIGGELKKAGLEDIRSEFIGSSEANFTSPNEKIVKLVRNNVEEVYGISPEIQIALGATDGKYFRYKGIPTIQYGPHPYNMGAPNEYTTIDELIGTTKVHLGVTMEYFWLGE